MSVLLHNICCKRVCEDDQFSWWVFLRTAVVLFDLELLLDGRLSPGGLIGVALDFRSHRVLARVNARADVVADLERCVAELRRGAILVEQDQSGSIAVGAIAVDVVDRENCWPGVSHDQFEKWRRLAIV